MEPDGLSLSLQQPATGCYLELNESNPHLPMQSFRRVRKTAKKSAMSFVIFVRLYAWNNSIPKGRFSWNCICEYFTKICREKSSFIEIWREFRALYMNTNIYIYIYIYIYKMIPRSVLIYIYIMIPRSVLIYIYIYNDTSLSSYIYIYIYNDTSLSSYIYI